MQIKIASSTVLLTALLTSMSVQAECNLSAQSINFGSYDVFDTAATESTGQITVTCTSSTEYSLLLSAGSGSYSARTMQANGENLIYNLYTDVAYSQIWGDGSDVSVIVSGNTAGTEVHDVFGRIPARQNATPAFYNDVITVTLEF
ncbi:spore coat protein U [Aliidiomarina minuta]|uniref:Spore coat protein U n=1 Tax=Aliidiomarina minuta TaxID=880057 RepID=A0A432W964_9GAMM|nr:spore coat U domain-containing protein [Aliidiomarina minuta]RUO26693.1 spore coat protein U [Aliidiomarina minuta]